LFILLHKALLNIEGINIRILKNATAISAEMEDFIGKTAYKSDTGATASRSADFAENN